MGGQEGGNDCLWGGQTCARSAHSEREARADFFFGQTCARSAHSERVSASRFFLGGGKHVRGAHIASA